MYFFFFLYVLIENQDNPGLFDVSHYPAAGRYGWQQKQWWIGEPLL